MSKKLLISSILFYIVSALHIILGTLYSLTSKLMPYHKKFLGKTIDQLDPKMAMIALMSLRIIGASYLAIGVTIIMLVLKPFKKGYAWTRWILITMTTINLLPALKVTLSVGKNTPLWIVVISLLLSYTAFFLSGSEMKNADS